MVKGKAFVISGPSGTGKDTIIRELLSRHPDLLFSKSCVTRPKRNKPEEDEKYTFLTVEQFENMLKNNELLEHNVYLDNYYGTPKAPVIEAMKNGDTMIIEVDVNGAYNIKRNLDSIKTIFVMPPSVEVLEERLRARSTDDEETIKKRIEVAVKEMQCAKDYDFTVINDRIDRAVSEVYEIICK